MFFNKEFYGNLYSPSISIQSLNIVRLADFVWANRATIKYDQLLKSAEFLTCVGEYPRIKQILEYNAADMIASVRDFKHPYVVQDNKIGYILPEGISYSASYGWKTIFAYYYERDCMTIT